MPMWRWWSRRRPQSFVPTFSPNTSGWPHEAKVSSMTDWWSWKAGKWQHSRTLTATTNGGKRQRTTRCLTSPYPTSWNAMPHPTNESAKWTSRTCFWMKCWRRNDVIWKCLSQKRCWITQTSQVTQITSLTWLTDTRYWWQCGYYALLSVSSLSLHYSAVELRNEEIFLDAMIAWNCI